MRQITPHLWYDTQAKEAAELYTSTFPDSKITNVTTITDTPSGDCDIVSFELCGQPFMAISAGPGLQVHARDLLLRGVQDQGGGRRPLGRALRGGRGPHAARRLSRSASATAGCQ